MKSRRLKVSAGIAISALMMLVSIAADAQQRQPKGESSSSTSRGTAQTRAPQSSPPPPRVAVPKGDSDRQPGATENQRRPRADGNRGTGGRFHGRGYHYPYYRGPYSYHPWAWAWGPYGYYPPYPWGLGVYWYPERMHDSMGALDLDIRPEKAQVYLDGHQIGVADDFDGWPRYLWLEEGTYDLVFHHEGFETIARQYQIFPGVVIDVEDRMERGEARLPDDLLARSAERREERLHRRAERGEMGPEGAREPAAWRDRVRSERAEVDELVDARSEPARLRLAVSPSDAAVYLDGRFLGTGDELSGVRSGLILDAGEHEIEVTRPGYRTESTTFTAEAGEEVEVEVDLDEE